MLSKLFRRSGKVLFDVALDKPLGPYYAGDSVQAQVRVRTKGGGVKVRRVEARLVSWRRYRQWEYSDPHDYEDDDDWDDEFWRRTWEEEEHIMGRELLLPAQTLPEAFEEEFSVAFSLPQDVAPPHQGLLSQEGWRLEVIADRPWAPDQQVELEIPLVVPPPGHHTQPGKFGKATHSDEVEMHLALPGLEFVEGETIEGELVVQAFQPVKGRQVRVTLYVQEFIPRNKPDFYVERLDAPDFRENTVAASAVLQEQVSVPQGETLRLPFQLEIPRLQRPTCTTGGQGWIRWMLEGTVDRRLARDYRVKQEIFVYNGR